MRARDTSSAGAWQGWTSWLRRREHRGGPALLYVTCGVTSLVVLAITLLAVTGHSWMVGVAFIALMLAVAALMGVLALMLTDRDGW
ncbi:MAG TPA: hypothetical protein VF032_15805 [Thermoleophilaceae bacterium]